MLESHTHFPQLASHKSNVHFALDSDTREHSKVLPSQRTSSPLPISNVTKCKSNSNSNLFTSADASVSTIRVNDSLIGGQHVLTVDIFNKNILKNIFELADTFQGRIKRKEPTDILKVIKNN